MYCSLPCNFNKRILRQTRNFHRLVEITCQVYLNYHFFLLSYVSFLRSSILDLRSVHSSSKVGLVSATMWLRNRWNGDRFRFFFFSSGMGIDPGSFLYFFSFFLSFLFFIYFLTFFFSSTFAFHFLLFLQIPEATCN